MARPKSPFPKLEKSVSLPETLCLRVDALYRDPIMDRVQHGAWSALIEALLIEALPKLEAIAKAEGKALPIAPNTPQA
jgi:hypothetical protein